MDERETWDSDNPRGASRSVDAAAIRWGERHPDADIDHPAPVSPPEDEHVVPNRHSASAEAASLRWHEMHQDEDF